MVSVEMEINENNLGGNVSRKDVEGGGSKSHALATLSSFMPSLKFMKKVGAEFIGTFFLMFSGYGSAVINEKTKGSITFLGVSLVWGMAVMILVYSLGHISGAHFNPAVTLAFATIPGYIGAQVLASILAGFFLRVMFGNINNMAATLPSETAIQSFVLEIFITFLLMFVVCAVATDTQAIGELAGLAVGTTIAMNVLVAGKISGASMNPARSIGSAVSGNLYKKLWIYLLAPPLGAIAGAWSYDMIRLSDKPECQVNKKSRSFLKTKSLP